MEKICLYCEKKFTTKLDSKKFCKYLCATKYRNIMMRKKLHEKLSDRDKELWIEFKKEGKLYKKKK